MDVRSARTPVWRMENEECRRLGCIHSVERSDSILSISWIFKLNKSKSRRVPGHPDVLQLSIAVEDILQLVLADVVAQVTHVHLGED